MKPKIGNKYIFDKAAHGNICDAYISMPESVMEVEVEGFGLDPRNIKVKAVNAPYPQIVRAEELTPVNDTFDPTNAFDLPDKLRAALLVIAAMFVIGVLALIGSLDYIN